MYSSPPGLSHGTIWLSMVFGSAMCSMTPRMTMTSKECSDKVSFASPSFTSSLRTERRALRPCGQTQYHAFPTPARITEQETASAADIQNFPSLACFSKSISTSYILSWAAASAGSFCTKVAACVKGRGPRASSAGHDIQAALAALIRHNRGAFAHSVLWSSFAQVARNGGHKMLLN